MRYIIAITLFVIVLASCNNEEDTHPPPFMHAYPPPEFSPKTILFSSSIHDKIFIDSLLYDSTHLVRKKQYSQTAESDNWTLEAIIAYEYTEDNLITEQFTDELGDFHYRLKWKLKNGLIEQWKILIVEENEWIPTRKADIYYSDGLLHQIIFYLFSEENWQDDQKIEYTYNNNGKVDEISSQTLDYFITHSGSKETQEWHSIKNFDYEGGRIISMVHSEKIFKLGGFTAPVIEKYDYSYQGDLLREIVQGDERISFEYDAMGRCVRIYYLGMIENWVMEITYQNGKSNFWQLNPGQLDYQLYGLPFPVARW